MTKYVNDNGVSEMWTNTKNYISAQLLGKSDVGHTHSASDITSGLATVATSGSYNDLSNKPTIPTVNNATLTIQKNGTNVQTFTANQSTNATANITVPTKTSDLTNDSGFITEDTTKIPLAGSNQISGSLIPATDNSIDVGSSTKNIKMLYTKGITINGTQFLPSDYLPKTGSNQISGDLIPTTDRTVKLGSNSYRFLEGYFGKVFCGGLFGYFDSGIDINYTIGANLILRGKNRPSETGIFWLVADDGSSSSRLMGAPNGTLTWNGQAVQTTSDQRLKQQISEIDNALLDAWKDVNLVQFKYNDAVDQKGSNARLHTGYVVQQIDEACKSHNVDISQYGLYCHEEYKEETREVENEDGTKETKVIRPASEHYSLRYTEALIVECAYLRKKLKELTARIEQLEKGNNIK